MGCDGPTRVLPSSLAGKPSVAFMPEGVKLHRRRAVHPSYDVTDVFYSYR